MQTNTPKLTQQGQECINKLPENGKKQSIISATCEALQKHSRNLVRETLLANKNKLAGAALLGAQALAPALASTPAPQETQKVEQSQTTQENKDNNQQSQEMLQIIDINQLPPELKSGVELTKTKYLEAVKDSNIRFPLIVKKTNGSPSDLVNDLPLAPKKTYEELTGDKEFLPKNYTKVVNALSDTSDLKTWYRVGKEKRLPTDEEIQKEIIRLENQKQRWLGKIQDWQTQIKAGTLDQRVFADFITLFNEGLKNLSMDSSRAALLRLLVDAGTMAQFKNVKGPLEKSIVQDLSNQVGEYIQLTDKNSKIVKIGYGQTSVDKFYLFPSKSDVNNNVVLKNYPFFENMGNDSLSYFNEESTISFKNLVANIQGVQLDSVIKQKEEKLSQDKVSLSQDKVSLSQDKVSLSQDKTEVIELNEGFKNSKDFLKLVQVTGDLMSKYVNTKDEQTLLEIKSNIEKIKSYKPIFETKLTGVARDNSLQTIILMETKYNEFVLAKN